MLEHVVRGEEALVPPPEGPAREVGDVEAGLDVERERPGVVEVDPVLPEVDFEARVRGPARELRWTAQVKLELWILKVSFLWRFSLFR